MSKIRLSLACGDYDRTLALRDGRVSPEGIELVYIPLPPAETFWRMLKFNEFDASEMSLSSYMTERCSANPRFIAIPVFPSRMFRHAYIFINNKAGISLPSDLKGKKVGVPEYAVTAALWIRGILQHEYGISPADVNWFTGGKEGVGRQDKMAVKYPDNLSMTQVSYSKSLSDMLASGEIDAMVSPMAPGSFSAKHPNVSRLFPNYKTIEEEYFKKTKIFPIMHTLVIKKDLYEADPWIAQSLYKAFSEAKMLCQESLRSGRGASSSMLPWTNHEYESVTGVMGDDFWPYGVEPNRPTLEAVTQYSFEQGLSDHKLTFDELFTANTNVVDVRQMVHK